MQRDSPAKTTMMATKTAMSVSIRLPHSARYAAPAGAHLPSGHLAGWRRPPRQYQLSGHCSRLWRSEQKKPLGAKHGMGGEGVDIHRGLEWTLYIVAGGGGQACLGKSNNTMNKIGQWILKCCLEYLYWGWMTAVLHEASLTFVSCIV